MYYNINETPIEAILMKSSIPSDLVHEHSSSGEEGVELQLITSRSGCREDHRPIKDAQRLSRQVHAEGVRVVATSGASEPRQTARLLPGWSNFFMTCSSK